MKAAIVVMAVLVALVTMSSAEINFSSGFNLFNGVSTADASSFNFIAKDPTRNIVWTDNSNIDLGTGDYSGTEASNLQIQVSFDKNHDAWVATRTGLIHKYVSGAAKTYTTADGLPSSFICYSVYDSSNNRLIVGTDGGLSIITLDANESPVSYANTLSVTIHTVMTYGKNIFAVNSFRLFWFDGTTWTTYDSTNSTITGSCGASAIDNQGNVYISGVKTANVAMTKCSVFFAKFNLSSKTWGKIDVSDVGDSVTSVVHVKIDRNNVMWMAFSVSYLYGVTDGYLAKMDLATGVVEKSPLNGTSKYSWLDESAWGTAPALGLTDDGNIIICGRGTVVIGGKTTAVLPRTLPAQLKRESYAQVSTYDLLGHRIQQKTFSKNSVSGILFNVYRSPDGSKVVAKQLITR